MSCCIALYCFEFCMASYYCRTTMIKSRLCMQIFHDISITVVFAGTSSINVCASTGLVPKDAQGLQNLPRSPWNRRKSTRGSHRSSPPQSWSSHPNISHLWPPKKSRPNQWLIGSHGMWHPWWRGNPRSSCDYLAQCCVLLPHCNTEGADDFGAIPQYPVNYKAVVQKQKHGYTVMSSDVMWYGVVRVVHPMSMVVHHIVVGLLALSLIIVVDPERLTLSSKRRMYLSHCSKRSPVPSSWAMKAPVPRDGHGWPVPRFLIPQIWQSPPTCDNCKDE